MIRFTWLVLATVVLTLSMDAVGAEQPDESTLSTQFDQTIVPFLRTYCTSCHGRDAPEAQLDLTVYGAIADVASAHLTWETILERLEAREMPPEDADRQPTDKQRGEVIRWLKTFREYQASRGAGDPGAVLPRRLSNAEYNYTIRDLTGVDIRPADAFPVDPANEAGFDNSAESLLMSPALLNKYLEAARQVVQHLVLTPDGLAFASYPITADTDRDKYCTNRILDFYRRQPTDYAEYFLACWLRRVSARRQSLEQIATARGISAKYLTNVWSLLTRESAAGPVAKLQAMWNGLPADEAEFERAQSGCDRMRDFVTQLRVKLQPEFERLRGGGIQEFSQVFVLRKNRQQAAHRMSMDAEVLIAAPDESGREVDLDLVIPAQPAERERTVASFELFCRIFPDAFYISERDSERFAQGKREGRFLSAGFHSMTGYFRDDLPLYELILDEAGQRELDALWREFDFVTSAPMRQYASFLWYERGESGFMRTGEFDRFRAEDKSAASAAMIEKLKGIYLAKARQQDAGEDVLEAAEDHFRIINEQIRQVERMRAEAQPRHLEAVQRFAQRAYRRPISNAERNALAAFYRALRDREGLDHEQAIRDTLVSVLVSPHFCFRLDLGGIGEGTRSLTDYELATRLSYFLWSSMPDEELLSAAAAGTLRQQEGLLEQTHRMLQDPRVVGFATEFVGNWLDFRRFEEHQGVDRETFPTFTARLRQAMFEEPIHFFLDVVQHDRPVLDFLYADHTFVNAELAKHYGVEFGVGDAAQWIRVDDASRFGRGGLLPMSVFLTKNSPGLRTSPVKRGYWVVRQLLGERIPPPPPDVPELPDNERDLGELSLRETLAKHREHKSCAGCHDRFDAFGLVFENYGPVGELREKDMGGRAVDTSATFPGGGPGEGLDGLRQFLRAHRQRDFLENLCRKLLSYSLGRTLLPTDDGLVSTMLQQLETNDYRAGKLIECIVTSPQFLNKRGTEPLVVYKP